MRIDRGMLELFYKDLSGAVASLRGFLREGGGPEEPARALQGIFSAAKLLHLPPLAALASELLDSLKRREKPELPESGVKELEELLREQPDEPSEWLQRREKEKRGKERAEKKPSFDPALFELFQAEVEAEVQQLNEGLLLLEKGERTTELFDRLMRSAHSLKGAARVLAIEPIVHLAHAIEDYFEMLKSDRAPLNESRIDALFAAIDLFENFAGLNREQTGGWLEAKEELIQTLIREIGSGEAVRANREEIQRRIEEKIEGKAPESVEVKEPDPEEKEAADRVLRVGTQNITQLMGLAGELMVESLWLQPFNDALLALKRSHSHLGQSIDLLRDLFDRQEVEQELFAFLNRMQNRFQECRRSLETRLYELEMFIRRHASLSERLYNQVVSIRMRPFSDGLQGFPRFARDLAKRLGKQVKLEIIGKETPVDRDILEKLETPLMHMIRNSIDHGIEPPEEREKRGKPREGTVRIEASHQGGMLAIRVSDDGRGVDLEEVRSIIKRDRLIGEEVVHQLGEAELLDFLFLPGFSTAKKVTEISGRGVGLNSVQNMAREVGGFIRTSTENGKHLVIHLQLPLTLAVSRCLLVSIGGEPYALPLARIRRTMLVSPREIETLDNCQYLHDSGGNIGLVQGYQVLELPPSKSQKELLSIVILTDRANSYGVVVDRFIGEKELVVHEIDPLIGKIPDILCGAFMEDGSPILIIDVEDLVESIDKLLYRGRLESVDSEERGQVEKSVKKILVVDDSITVREVESRLLQNSGYQVQTAVNGMDGWNAVRVGRYDLVITDVDMPRMDGIELVRSIKKDPKLRDLPVMIVSYKDREEDRRRGLDAGADYYLTKSSFHDATLLDAVKDLIGEP